MCRLCAEASPSTGLGNGVERALVEQHHSVMLGLRGLFRRPVDGEPANRCRSLSDVDIFLLQAHGFARTHPGEEAELEERSVVLGVVAKRGIEM